MDSGVARVLPVLWTPGVYTLTSVLKTRRADFQTCETLVNVMRQTNDLDPPWPEHDGTQRLCGLEYGTPAG
jgi:hypothetical protein